MEKVERDPDTDCLLWAAGRDGGYGRFRVDGKAELAHRWLFIQVHGFAPLVVRHACDNPPCVNIDHLLPGTNADNVRDRVVRDRGARKLTHVEVIEIREEYAKGVLTQKMLADVYGVNRTVIGFAVRRETWRHI